MGRQVKKIQKKVEELINIKGYARHMPLWRGNCYKTQTVRQKHHMGASLLMSLVMSGVADIRRHTKYLRTGLWLYNLFSSRSEKYE